MTIFGKKTLDSLFSPKSIAVIGASNTLSKIGGYIFSEILHKKEIKAYPVNLKEKKIQGVKAYISIKEISQKIDLIIIVVPSVFVLDILREGIKKGIKTYIIISAGFKETNEEGKKREEELKKLIKGNKLTVVGPNCLGIINAESKLNCSFAKDIPLKGGIALISQSGAVIDGIIDWSFKHSVGFSKIVSLGNMAGVDELEMLEYLKEDSQTRAIVFYMETLEKGTQFAKVLKETSHKKPVIIIKPGSSKQAKQAIGSHTGSLAQDNILVETLLRENNAIIANNLHELYNLLIALKGKKAPTRPNTIILTNAGGPGVIATDGLDSTPFKLTKLTPYQKHEFKELPNEASINNPIDILGDAQSDRYEYALKKLESTHHVDNILVLLTPQIMTDSLVIAKKLVEFSKKSHKFCFSSFLGGKEIKEALEILEEENFPNFQTPQEALLTIGKLLDYTSFHSEEIEKFSIEDSVIKPLKEQLKKEKGLLSYNLTREILEVFSIGLPKKFQFKTKKEIEDFELSENKKYVLKFEGKDFVHKTDIGGVQREITSLNFYSKASSLLQKIKELGKEGHLTLEEEIDGVQVIIGLKSTPDLGNFIMFGTGGIYVNVFKDISFATCPLSISRAKKLVQKTKIAKLLNGYRGSKPVNLDHLYTLLTRMSYLQETFPEIKEVDLNPVICNEQGLFLVDVKLIV